MSAASAAANEEAASGDAGGGAASLAGRIIETTEELITLRYRRSGEMQQHILTWMMSLELWVVSAGFLFGVLLLETGSVALNNALYYVAIGTVVLSLWTIAVMDVPCTHARTEPATPRYAHRLEAQR